MTEVINGFKNVFQEEVHQKEVHQDVSNLEEVHQEEVHSLGNLRHLPKLEVAKQAEKILAQCIILMTQEERAQFLEEFESDFPSAEDITPSDENVETGNAGHSPSYTRFPVNTKRGPDTPRIRNRNAILG